MACLGHSYFLRSTFLLDDQDNGKYQSRTTVLVWKTNATPWCNFVRCRGTRLPDAWLVRAVKRRRFYSGSLFKTSLILLCSNRTHQPHLHLIFFLGRILVLNLHFGQNTASAHVPSKLRLNSIPLYSVNSSDGLSFSKEEIRSSSASIRVFNSANCSSFIYISFFATVKQHGLLNSP